MTSDPPKSSLIFRWPHTALLPDGRLIFGPIAEESGVGNEVRCERAELKKLLAEIARMNGALKMSGKHEGIICPELLDILPEDTRSLGTFWDAVHGAPHMKFLLLTRNPVLASPKLPANWGQHGYSNVCIGVSLDSGAEENRQRLTAFKKIPAGCRAVILRGATPPDLPDGWEQGLQWVIVNGSDNQQAWTEIRSACQSAAIPYFYFPSKHVEPGAVEPDVADIRHHPFKAPLNLFATSPYARLLRPKAATPPATTESNIGSESPPAPLAVPDSSLASSPDEAVSSLVPQAPARTASFPNVSPLVDIALEEPEEETDAERFVRLDQVGRAGIRAAADAGLAFLEIRDNELWREGGYQSWNHYCESILETSRSYINRLIGHALINRELQERQLPIDPYGEPILPTGESQSRPLTKLTDSKERSKAWRIAVKRADGVPTAKIVTAVVDEILGSEAPTTPQPSRAQQRLEVIKSLREAALSKAPWNRIVALIDLLENLESPKPLT